ncbi:uncharacterized protein BDR25DRAFT_319349 [Lindgomyces ingoldianus]|uniref:Uncharacterized protein n=1 Tax=Lindgomyces ingoldianus TaxID=673940 RepID=A0ACB6QD40_9PLEO|nr:uncharacterized protein BDR25DRAFT_319349 [Lindgomyces ingoldianus]KAF2464292.1 hypothetical protein BDR25DRAFT_319349 [Lindgomyces ingoldianus]
MSLPQRYRITANTIPAVAIADAFALSGTSVEHKSCIRCGENEKLWHRLQWLDCPRKCVLCGRAEHRGDFCFRMPNFFPGVFTRAWFAEHAALGGWLPWENEGYEFYILVRDEALRQLEYAPSTKTKLANAIAEAEKARVEKMEGKTKKMKIALQKQLNQVRVRDQDEEKA